LVLPVSGVELVPGLYELFLLGGNLEFQPLLVRLRLLQPLLQARDLQSKKLCFLYIFGGLECVGHASAYVAHFVFWELSGIEPRELPKQAGALPT
jgi:hypothetical protein